MRLSLKLYFEHSGIIGAAEHAQAEQPKIIKEQIGLGRNPLLRQAQSVVRLKSHGVSIVENMPLRRRAGRVLLAHRFELMFGST
jgi:hypothetical protein